MTVRCFIASALVVLRRLSSRRTVRAVLSYKMNVCNPFASTREFCQYVAGSGSRRRIRDGGQELGQGADRRAKRRRSVIAGGGLSGGHGRERTECACEGLFGARRA